MHSWRRFTRYPHVTDDHSYRVSSRDEALIRHALNQASDHDSGGSYSMAAVLGRPKPVEVGFNALDNPAWLKHDSYPQLMGMHAELHLFTRATRDDMDGSTVAIHGVASKSRNPMNNTLPCVYCGAILVACNVRWVLCIRDTDIVKLQPAELFKPTSLKGRMVR